MYKAAVVVAFVGGALSCSQVALAECSRGAACLSRPRKPSAGQATPVEQRTLPRPAPAAEPVASEVDRPTSTQPPGKRPWYGWQLLIIDGAVVATLASMDLARARGKAASGVAFSLGLVFDVAPPIVHAVHHRGGIAWASFGVRTTLPFTILLSTLLAQSCRGVLDAKCLDTTAVNISGYVGLAAASAIDAALFSRENPTRLAPSRAKVQWSPIVAPRLDGATIGVQGTF